MALDAKNGESPRNQKGWLPSGAGRKWSTKGLQTQGVKRFSKKVQEEAEIVQFARSKEAKKNAGDPRKSLTASLGWSRSWDASMFTAKEVGADSSYQFGEKKWRGRRTKTN